MIGQVRFGDLVTIQGTFVQKNSEKAVTVNGFVCTSGFTTNELYFEQLPKQIFDSEAGSSSAAAISAVRNYRDFIFQIWPKLDFDAHKKYSKLKEEKKAIEKRLQEAGDEELKVEEHDIPNNNNNEEENQPNEYLEEVIQKLQDAKVRMNQEKINNMKQIDNVKGGIVTYGQEIFLMHADSEQFVNGLALASETEKSAFMVQVSKIFSRGMVFKFQPRYKLRKDGDPIEYKDQLYIVNVKQNSTASFQPANLISLDKPITGSQQHPHYYKSVDFKKHVNRQRSEIYLSKQRDATWQLHFHSEYVEPDDLQIRGGDLICLYHTEMQGTLTADLSYNNNKQNAEAYIRRYEGEHKEERYCVSSIWEVQVDSLRTRGSPVQVSDLQSAEKGTSQSYKLRHFLTGKILSLGTFTSSKGKEYPSPILAADDQTQLETQSKVQFVSTQADDKDQMETNLCYIVKLANQYLVSNSSAEFSSKQNQADNKPASQSDLNIVDFKNVKEDMIFKPIDESEFEISKYPVICVEKGATEQNAFQIIKLSKQDKDDILFIQSSLELIYRFINKIRNVSKGEPLPRKETIKRINIVLSELIFFLVKGDGKDALLCEGIASAPRQRMMKDFRYIELLVDMLYYPMHLEVYKISELDSLDSEVIRMFKLCNCLITHTIKEYRPNEVYASQWIDLLIFQSVMTQGDCDIGSEETLTELIDNNKKILEQIDEVTVRKFLKMLYDERDQKYAKLVSALVLCNGQPVPNQELVSKLMLSGNLPANIEDPSEDDDYENQFDTGSTSILALPEKTILYTKMQNGQIYVQDPFAEESNAYILLKDFQKQSKESPEKQEKFDFFVSMISLLSDLCSGRNYEAINPLSRVFKRQTAFAILKSTEFSFGLRQAFAQLIHTMYVDVSEIKKCRLPNFIRTWTEIDANSQTLSIASVFDEIDRNSISQPQFRNVRYISQNLISFITGYLSNIAKAKYMSAIKEELNRLTLQILKMAALIVDFGFFDKTESIQELLRNLLKILNSTIDIADPAEKEVSKAIISILSAPNTKGNIPLMLKKQKGITFNRFKSRYELSEDNSIVQECKVICCLIIKRIVLIRNDMRVTEFMKKFKHDYDSQLKQSRGPKTARKSFNILKSMEIEAPAISKNNSADKGGKTLLQTPEKVKYNGTTDDPDFFVSADEENKKKQFGGRSPFQIIQEIMQNKTSIRIRGSIKIDVIAILQDLSLYESPSVVNSSFEIIDLLFTERQTIVDFLSNLQLLENSDSIKMYLEIKRVQNELLDRIEKSENWLFKNTPKALQDALVVEENLQALSKLLGTKKQEPRVNEPDEEDIPITKKLSLETTSSSVKAPIALLFDEDEMINESTQQLMCNCNIFEQVIDLLKYDAATFSRARQAKQLTQADFQDDSIHLRIIRSCYRFLGRFVCRNQKNQQALTQIFTEFTFRHLRTIPQVNICYLLEPLIANNSLILTNDDLCRRIVRSIINCVNKIQPFDPRLAANYLDVLRTIPYLGDSIIKENQTLIIDELTYRTNINLLLPLQTQDPNFSKFSIAVSKLEEDIEKSPASVIDVPGEIDYFNSLIYLMAVICDQKNNATESKAQSYLPLKSLSQLITQFSNCFYVKRYLYFFFFHVFLDTEKQMSDELMQIKQNIIHQIEKDLDFQARNISAQSSTLQTYRGLSQVQQLKQEYIFESLFLCIDTIFIKKLFDASQKQRFYGSMLSSITIISPTTSLSDLDKKKLKAILVFLVQKNFCSLTSLKEAMYNKYIQSTKQTDIIPTSSEVNQFKKNLYENQPGEQNKFPKVLSHSTRDAPKASILRAQVSHLQSDPLFQVDIRNDFKAFVDYFTNIKNISQATFMGVCTIDFQELTSSMIKFMIKHRSSSQESDEQVVNELSKKRLQVLRQIIELENPDDNRPVDEWESTGDYGDEIKKRQDKLVEQGIVKMIVEIVKDGTAPFDLKEEAILLGIALLIGGNLKTQESFLGCLEIDSKNWFLSNLHETITKGMQVIKKGMSKWNKSNELRRTQLKREVLEKKQHEGSQDGDVNDNLSDDELLADKLSDDGIQVEGDNEIPNNVLKEIEKVRRVYRLLQLFCEGHNSQLQNHLRVQIINKQESGKSMDFVFNSSLNFANLTKNINIHCVGLTEQVLDFLIEVIQGPCAANQIVMCRGKIIETCKEFQFRMNPKSLVDLTAFGFEDDEQLREVNSVVNKTFQLLYSLIEGSASPDIFQMLCSTLDIEFLVDILVQKYNELKLTVGIKKDDFEDIMEKVGNKLDEGLSEVFDIYLLISTLSDRNEEIKQMLDNPGPEREPALQFFKKNTGSIEILFQQSLIRVYFPVQPICRLLSKSTRVKLMDEIPRQTPSEKIEGLVEASVNLFDEMEHQAYLKSQIFFFSSQRLDYLQLFSYCIALAINISILFSYKLKFSGFGKAENSSDDNVDTATTILGIIQFCLTIIMLLFWIIINAPVILKRYWHEKAESAKKNESNSEEEVIIVEAKLLPLQDALIVLNTKGPDAPEFQKGGVRDFGHLFVSFQYYWKCFQFLMIQGPLLYLIFYTMVSAMGLFLSDIVYCLHLLDIIMRFPSLQNVIRAVTTNIGQLGLTTLLGAVIIYIYTILAYYFTDNTFHESDAFGSTGDSGDENTCTTLFQCYLFTLNKGLVSGGGVGEAVARPSYSDDSNTFTFRYVFDLTFFMIINITFLNFIFGIIIDTFAQLRDEKQQKEEDMRDVCFICGLTRDSFDRSPGGFNIHIEEQHQLWFYLYYIYHLRTKESTSYNGVESSISAMIEGGDTGWFPMLQAMSLSTEVNQDNEEQIESKFAFLKSNLKEASTKFDKLQFKSSTAAAGAPTGGKIQAVPVMNAKPGK